MLGKLVGSFVALSQGVEPISFVDRFTLAMGGCAVKTTCVTGSTDMAIPSIGCDDRPPILRIFIVTGTYRPFGSPIQSRAA